MNYTLISEYIDAIINAEENLDRLSNLRPIMNVNGEPIMSSGNFAVVFKMTDGTKEYALKCFLKDQIEREDAYRMIGKELKSGGLYEMVRVQYFDNELFVDTKRSTCNEFPVVCMNWVEGITMDNWLILNADKKEKLVKFYNRFHELYVDLLCSHVAHGDIKPDNILVQGDDLN